MRATKPDKPYRDFPLTAHPNGTWCKKIKGKLHHFGGWSDPDAALKKYRHDVDDLQAGREPEPMSTTEQLSLIGLCNEFLDSKELLVQSGELSRRMHFDYLKIGKRICGILGRDRIVENLKPKDFDLLRSKMGEGVGKVTLANRIRLARILFKFAADQDLIENPLKLGQNFKEPGKKTIRAERNKSPAKDFTADELQSLIDSAKPVMKAMILLGINCGFGNTDCSSIPQSAFNLKSGWLDYPRPKTHIERRCPLWPETVKALRAAIAIRPDPKDENLAGLTFVTKYGAEFVKINEKGTILDAIGGEFRKLMVSLKLNGHRRAFYSLRRTFETVGGNSRDQIAVDYIMGHASESDDMGAIYRQSIDDQRLKDVTNHVRTWLWPPKKKRVKKAANKK